MQEKLVIYLHAQDLEHPSWAVVADGVLSQCEMHDNALGFSQIAEDKEVIVFVPAEDVLLTSVVLPKMSRARLAQALPFALEEKLIDDVETLHFVYGDHQGDQHLPVAVVSHARMAEWLDLLKSWNLEVDLLTPVYFALPFDEKTWHILVTDIAVARTGHSQGFACDKNNLEEILNLALSEAEQIPQFVSIHNYTDLSFHALTKLTTVNEEKHEAESFITDITRYIDTLPAFNLLQGQYASKKSKFPRRDKLWKVTLGFAVTWICLLFSYPAISYFILKQRVNQINAQIAQIYTRHFPQSTSMVAPTVRIQEKLEKLNAQMGQNHLLLLLGYIGKGMQATEGIKIKRIDYQNNQLTVELNATSSEDFSAFTNFLTNSGLSVRQQSANLTGSRVNATLLVE